MSEKHRFKIRYSQKKNYFYVSEKPAFSDRNKQKLFNSIKNELNCKTIHIRRNWIVMF